MKKFLFALVALVVVIAACTKDEDKGPAPVAMFTVGASTIQLDTSHQATILVNNQSENATSYLWEFDGKTSTKENPSFIVTTAGTKPLKLTATNEAGSDSHSVTITVLD